MSVRCLGFFLRHLILVSRVSHFHVHPRATRINVVGIFDTDLGPIWGGQMVAGGGDFGGGGDEVVIRVARG